MMTIRFDNSELSAHAGIGVSSDAHIADSAIDSAIDDNLKILLFIVGTFLFYIFA